MIKKLRKYMEDNDINQKQLSSLMGIGQAHMSKLLTGKKKAGAKTYERYHRLPGIREEQALRAILNYLMLEFSRGNFSREQLDQVMKPAENIIDTQRINPGD